MSAKPVSPEAEALTARFRQLSEEFTGPGKNLVASHNGELTQDKISAIASHVENQMEVHCAGKGATKKIFNIVIETLQNILIHGGNTSDGRQCSYFLIGKDDNEYTVSSGNFINTNNVESLKQKLNKIKTFDEKLLKSRYMEVLSNGQLSDKGGAGLGFLTIALKSGNTMTFDFEKVNDEVTIFKLQSKIIS